MKRSNRFRPMLRRNAEVEVSGLFLTEAEIARRLGLTRREWAAKAEVLERHGLPRIDPLIGGRYWPAIVAFFDRRYGVSNVEASQPDGGENLDALR
jgi:hypothetical protein